jgi:hypothetical protein
MQVTLARVNERLYADRPKVREKQPAFRAVAEEFAACKH